MISQVHGALVVFGIDNGSSSHADDLKNNFLVLGEGLTSGINEKFGSPKKKISINFIKANIKFCLSLHYNAEYSYLFVNGNVKFPTQFFLGSIPNGFSGT